MNKTTISYKRHIAKTISYRIVSTGIGFLTMWWVSGSFKIGAAFGVAELLYKPIQYYIHERIWYKWIKFGVINEPQKKKKTEVKLNNEDVGIIKTEEILTPKTPIKKTLNYSSNR